MKDLTPRELQILELASFGLTSIDIAKSLGIKPQTVRNQRVMISRKLVASNTAHAVAIAKDKGII